jgi:RHS repeat-associated protein
VLGGLPASFTYDGAGDRLSLTDGKNQTTTWTYDAYGNVSNKVDAANNLIFIYKYDPDNRLTNRWSAAKGTTVYRYNAAGSLTNIDYSGGTVTMPSVYLAYDILNRLTNMVDAVGTTVYGYDSVSELLSEADPWVNDTVSYTYANRLRTGLSLSQPSGSWSQSYGYDLTRRLTNVTSQAGSFGYQYAGSGPSTLVSRLALPNGAYITDTYDSVARMLSTKLLNSSSAILDSESYAYNLAGQRTAETNTAGDFRNYTYDNASELTSAISKEAGGVTNRWQEQSGYTYDAAGNLNYLTNNALVQTFNVNNLNELTTGTHSGTLTVAGTTTTPATNVTVNGLIASLYADSTFASTNQTVTNAAWNTYTATAQDSYGRISSNSVNLFIPSTAHYSYDLNGNLVSEQSPAGGTNRIFNYDDENQLISVCVTNVWRNDFVYDGKFRRRIERDYSWTGSAWTQTNEVHFIYDGNVVIQERNANNNPLVTYTRSGSSLLARTDYGQEVPGSPTTAYYHADGNGNITMLIYTNQIIAAKYLYDPFGNTLSLSGPLASLNVYRFASKEWNNSAGIYNFGRRYYDPMLQRFINRDPLAEQGGINLYAYVANNPINEFDPQGLCDSSSWNNFWNWLLGPDPIANDPIFNDPIFGTASEDPDWVDHLIDFAILDQQIGAQQDAQQLANMNPAQQQTYLLFNSFGAASTLELGGPEMAAGETIIPAYTSTTRAFWTGDKTGLPAAQASGASVLQLSPEAVTALANGNPTLMFQESAKWAAGATGETAPVFIGTGQGSTFWNYEFPQLMNNLNNGSLKSITFHF